MIEMAYAETLQAVTPGTDWIGVGIVVSIVLVLVLLVGYIVHIKRMPGRQFGEEELERLADLIARKQSAPPTPPADALTYDGIAFANQSALDEYKAAKAVVDKHKSS